MEVTQRKANVVQDRCRKVRVKGKKADQVKRKNVMCDVSEQLTDTQGSPCFDFETVRLYLDPS